MTPIELARELDLRVEAVMDALRAEGVAGLDYESELVAPQVAAVRRRLATRSPWWKRLLARFLRRPSAEELDRELFARATGTAFPDRARDVPEPSLGQDLSFLAPDAEGEMPGEQRPAPPASVDLRRVEINRSGELDLGSLLGAMGAAGFEQVEVPAELPEADEEEEIPEEVEAFAEADAFVAPSDEEDDEVDLAALLEGRGETHHVEAGVLSPEAMLGLELEGDVGDDDFDLQALLDSSFVEAPGESVEEDEFDLRTELVVEEPRRAAPTAKSKQRVVLVAAATVVMLASAVFIGRMFWVYYQEHRPGGDEVLYAAGMAALEAGNYPRASDRLGRLIHNYPESGRSEEAFFAYADALFGEGKYPAAVGLYRRALDFQEDRVEATPGMDYPDVALRRNAERQVARGLAHMSEYAEAARTYQDLLQRYGRDSIAGELRIELAELYSAWGRRQGDSEVLHRALSRFEEALILDPENPDSVAWSAAAGRLYVDLASLAPASAEENLQWAREQFNLALSKGRRTDFKPGQEEAILADLGHIGERTGAGAVVASAYRLLLSASPTLAQQAQAHTGLAELEMRGAVLAEEEAERDLRRLQADMKLPIGSLPSDAEFERQPDGARMAAWFRGVLAGTREAREAEWARAGLARLAARDAAFMSARKHAEQLIETAEDDNGRALGHFMHGDVAWQEGHLGDMAEDYQSALKLTNAYPNLAERAHLRMIHRLYVVEHDYDRAMKQIEKVLSDYPGGRYAYYARYLQGQCHEAMGNPARAADAYAQVVLGFPEARFADRRLRRDARFRLAAAHQAAGRYERAADGYIDAINEYAQDPRASVARMALAECRRQAGDLDLAVGDYEMFLEEFPDHPAATEARMRLADAYLEYYDFDKARRQFAEVARAGTDSATEMAALAGVAKSFEAEARTAGATEAGRLLLSAERAWELAHERKPGEPAPLVQMADLAERRGDLAGAYGYLQRYVAELPESASAASPRLRMGQLAARLERWDEVARILAEPPPKGALEREPVARWNLLAGEALRRQGRVDEATACYQLALKAAQPRSLLADEITRKLKDLEYRQEARKYSSVP